MNAPCADVGCPCFARPGHATCAGHDPAMLAALARERGLKVDAAERALRLAARLLLGRERLTGFHDTNVRRLRGAIADYLAETA
jgi:hypothetical protein